MSIPGETRKYPDVVTMFENCLGCKWTLHVIRQVASGIHRPGELERTADGLTAKVLNERLVKLVNFGLFDKQSYAEIPPRVEYHLTPVGIRFVEILKMIDDLQEEQGGQS